MRRRTIIASGLASAVVIAGLVVVSVPGRSGPPAPLPSSTSSAATVARAFLDAAVRRDCPGMRALSDPDDTDWCPESRWEQWTAEGDPTMHEWDSLRSVSARSEPEQCFIYELSQDGLPGMASGRNTWGLCLRRHRDGWRVAGEEVG